MGTVSRLPTTRITTWSSAVDRFLTARALSPRSKPIYAYTLTRVGERLPVTRLDDLTPATIEQALADAYPSAAAASWNRHVATVRSFLAYTTKQGWTPPDLANTLERRREVIDHTKALDRAAVARLLTRKDIPVRERCLWRMLYETAARAEEILSLNVEDLDLAQRRAVTIRKGGAIDTIHWQTGTARLLPYVIAGRTDGPLFLAARPVQQRRAPAVTDIDPTTGLARLSYRRAAEIFKEATGGWTLHQLRHSQLTHMAEAGTDVNMLMAKSRHQSLRTLQRYVHPSTEAVARLTASLDPARRR